MNLLSPVRVGALTLPNRVLMAPLTRTRADADNVPGELMARHYAQRASAGLIFAEATMVSDEAQAWPYQPSIHSSKHVDGWRLVTRAVRASGGRISLQIWHPGRATHPDLNRGQQPVSSSDKPIRNDVIRTPSGKQPYPKPRRLDSNEIAGYVQKFRVAAEHARAAEFDGVQIHGAHGYLVDQFLRDGVNDRTDAYGGSFANRARLLFEIVDAVVGVWGPDRVGLRFSPLVPFNDMVDSDPKGLVEYVAKESDRRNLAHVELRHDHWDRPAELELARIARANYRGSLLRNGGFDRLAGERALNEGLADAIVYGTAFLANPDLPRRFLLDAPLNPPNPATFYGSDGRGYIDYAYFDPLTTVG
jgi:N-ethylmaleimide reductase